MPVVTVNSAAGFASLAANTTYNFTADITLSVPPTMTSGTNIIVNGSGHTITVNSGAWPGLFSMSGVKVSDLKVDGTGATLNELAGWR